MKKIIIFILLAAGVIGGLYLATNYSVQEPVSPIQTPEPPQVEPEQPKEIEPDVPEALKTIFRLAVVSDKQVFLFLTMDNCFYCDKMKTEVFPKIDMTPYAYVETKDKTVTNHYMRDEEGFPTYILFDKAGKELKRHSGYLNLNEFTNWLR